MITSTGFKILFFILLTGYSTCVSAFTNEYVNSALNRAVYQSGAADYDHTAHLTADGYQLTFWKGKGEPADWIYTDLGTKPEIASVIVYWKSVFSSAYRIEISTAGPAVKPENWHVIFETQTGNGGVDSISFKPVSARYVRLVCLNGEKGKGPEVTEFEIYGTDRVQPVIIPQKPVQKDGKLVLSGGNWVLKRQSFVEESGEQLSRSDFKAKDWIPATVPGTVLVSYLNNGSLPDPNYGDQQLMISEEFFTAPFWYRNTFTIPESYSGKKIWLNFDGINRKSQIFVNGKRVGDITGAFIRGKFDLTGLAEPGKPCGLAVLILPNENPGAVTEQHLNDPDGNGGIIGLDGPSIVASIGWNWMPTIRGRNAGIWQSVFLEATGSVILEDPYLITDLNLPDTTRSDIFLEVTLVNQSAGSISGNLVGSSKTFSFQKAVVLSAGERKTIRLNKTDFPQFSVKNPKLWWPAGYGSQHLDTLQLQFTTDSHPSDKKEIVFGIRKFTYNYDQNHLKVSVNGFPIVIRGGNWGMAESMLRTDAGKYDLWVRLHRDMNLNMIRNWVGMVGDDAFYQACDRYGLLIWDDFWLANPVDGSHPKDNALFMSNAADKVKRFRNHASVALWVGRNEGYPPAVLDSSLRVMLSSLDNSRHYLSSSADRPVTGLGPYENKSPEWYFTNRGTTFHSEQGIVAVPVAESMRDMMPADKLWPVNDMWGLHDWTQPRVRIYTETMDCAYGKATSLDDFCRKAQMLNMEAPKAMMETWQSQRGGGVLLWMSHPAWPSLICQTYDYFLEPTAAFFAIKKGSEPVHVFWNPVTNQVQVANNTLKNLKKVTVSAELFDLNGKKIYAKSQVASVLSNSASVLSELNLPAANGIQFLNLKLTGANGQLVSSNFYWRGRQSQRYRELNDLKEVRLTTVSKILKQNGKIKYQVTLTNSTSGIALMTRLSLVKSSDGKRILPVHYSDNYVSFTPGETKVITLEPETGTDVPVQIKLEGWNVPVQFSQPAN